MEGAELEKGGPVLGGSTAYGSAQALRADGVIWGARQRRRSAGRNCSKSPARWPAMTGKALCAWLLHPSVTAAEQSWGKTGFVVCPLDVL